MGAGVLSGIGYLWCTYQFQPLFQLKTEKDYWTILSKRKRLECLVNLIRIFHNPKIGDFILKDILEDEVDEKYYLSDAGLSGMLKHQERHKSSGNGFGVQFVSGESEKSNTILQRYYKDCKDNAVCIPEATAKGYVEIEPGECFDAENINSKTRRGRKMEDKSNCIMAKETDFMHYTPQQRVRRLTPTECARLQTIPDWYEWVCSDTQCYKMLGNGWTVAVIEHIFRLINTKTI